VDQNTQKKTLLLVDDAPSNIQTANSILKDIYKIRIATNGAKALELVKLVPYPDLILLDVVMPGMDGYEVCARLKTIGRPERFQIGFLHEILGVGRPSGEPQSRAVQAVQQR